MSVIYTGNISTATGVFQCFMYYSKILQCVCVCVCSTDLFIINLTCERVVINNQQVSYSRCDHTISYHRPLGEK